jgi:hypothetical protein
VFPNFAALNPGYECATVIPAKAAKPRREPEPRIIMLSIVVDGATASDAAAPRSLVSLRTLGSGSR